ncbi:MAG: M56 family metallopeptidase [Firmicutes bacterium]|nr:M56 family metallopeptidase [Bacillota bacterium]
MAGDILNLCITVTVAATGILLVKKVFDRKITPRGHMLMWLLLAAVIVIWPVQQYMPASTLAVKNYVPQVSEQSWEEVNALEQEVHYGPSGDDGVYQEVLRSEVSMTVPVTGKVVLTEYMATPSRIQFNRSLWFIIWAAGTLITGLVFYLPLRRMRQKAACLEICRDEETLAIFNELKEKLKITAGISLRTGAKSTMLMAGSNPVICLEDGYTADELRHVLAHELTHYKHRDLLKNKAAALVVCVFWWNPVMWLAFRRFRHDMEVYCDYDAALLTGDRKGYAMVLVKAAAGTGRFVLGTTSLIGGEKEVSSRVKFMAAFKKPRTWVCVIAVVVLAAAGLALVMNPKSGQRIMEAETYKEVNLHYTTDIGDGWKSTLTTEEAESLFDAVNNAKKEETTYSDSDVQDVLSEPFLKRILMYGKQGGTTQITYAYDCDKAENPVQIYLNGRYFVSSDNRLIRSIDKMFKNAFPYAGQPESRGHQEAEADHPELYQDLFNVRTELPLQQRIMLFDDGFDVPEVSTFENKYCDSVRGYLMRCDKENFAVMNENASELYFKGEEVNIGQFYEDCSHVASFVLNDGEEHIFVGTPLADPEKTLLFYLNERRGYESTNPEIASELRRLMEKARPVTGENFSPEPASDFSYGGYDDINVQFHCWYAGSEIADLHWTSHDNGRGGTLLIYLQCLDPAVLEPMTDEEVLIYISTETGMDMTKTRDHWAEFDLREKGLGIVEVIHDRFERDNETAATRIIYNLPDGTHKGYKVADPQLAYVLATCARTDSRDKVVLGGQYQICTADKSWQEALELFKANYPDLKKRFGIYKDGFWQDTETTWSMYNRFQGTAYEHKDSRIRTLEIQDKSEGGNVITIYHELERTYLNDISQFVEFWAGGGMDCVINADGTTTYWCGHLGHLVNDGKHWYYVEGNKVGYNPDLLLDENGQIKEGVIQY